MKTLELIKEFVDRWRDDVVLRDYTISSTRVPANTKTQTTVFPYAFIEARLADRGFSSSWQASEYYVEITFYGGEVGQATTTLLEAAVERMDYLYNFDVRMDLYDAYVIGIWPDQEDPDKDMDDYYGKDIRYVKMRWRVLLSEYRNNTKLF